MNTPYTHADLNPMSWEEFGTTLEKLASEIASYAQNHGIAFDAVAPLLRSGGVPGFALAIHLGVGRIIPLQFRYRYDPVGIETLIGCDGALGGLPETPRILIVETNTSSGATAKLAIEHLRTRIRGCVLYYATVAKVFGGPEHLDGVEHGFHGVATNERRAASPEQAAALGLREGVTLFPWEIAEMELREMNAGGEF